MSVIYLTAQEAAIIMGCTAEFVRDLWQNGRMKFVYLPGSRWYKRTTAEWIREAMGDPAPTSERTLVPVK